MGPAEDERPHNQHKRGVHAEPRTPQAPDDTKGDAQDTGGPRVLIFSGKGGVGKTTLAAATGLHTARSGKRTIVISIDVAHSLADAFDLTQELAEHPRGTPYQVEKNLQIQEIDVQEEVFRHWNEVHRYFTVLFAQSGMQEVVAEDLALIPGMEDVIALLYLNDYTREKNHDVVILDLAPTGESLRFVSMPDTLDWYMRRVYRFERNLMRAARPLAKRLTKIPLPEESYFKEIENLWNRMDGVDKILTDPSRTTVRLVTNPERMVIKETQRAHLYFSLHGVVVDEVLVNRVLPEDLGELPPFFANWRRAQQDNLERIRTHFVDLPVHQVPLMEEEVLGVDRLAGLARTLYGDPREGRDPTAKTRVETPYRMDTQDGEVVLRVQLPHLDKRTLDVWVEREELILRIASQKHHLPLPRRLSRQQPTAARYTDGWLTVHFPHQDGGEETHTEEGAEPTVPGREESLPISVQQGSQGASTRASQDENTKNREPTEDPQ